MILLPQKVAYRGTISGLRISSVDGTAFLDNCAALVPYADGSHLVEIYDASNRMLRGVLKAAGTGETTTDVLTYATLNLTSGWTTTNATITDADSFVNTGLNGYVRKASTTIAGKLYKSSISATVSAGTVRIQSSSGIPIYAVSGAGDKYATAGDSLLVVVNVAGGIGATTDITAINVASVDAPSSSGATIVSAKGGTTENFAYKDASFTYNASSYQIVVRAAR